MSDQFRVGFDALFLEQPMTGVGQYATQLWRGLAMSLPAQERTLLLPSNAADAVREQVDDSQRVGYTPDLPRRLRKIWWEQIGLPLAIRDAQPDVVHIPYFSAPTIVGPPLVVTIHDVIPLVLPAYRGSWSMRAYLRLLQATIRQATLILTDSEHSKRDITRHLAIDSNRVVVIPLGVGEQYRPISEADDAAAVDDVLERYGIERPYLLNIGGHDQRKNLDELIAAFALALPTLPGDVTLVIGGRPHTGNRKLYPPLDRALRRHDVEERVHFTGFIADEDLPVIYRHAEAFVFPSVYEGFGLDPLEALASGVPVICSNRSSLPEIVGEAGLLVEPEARPIAEAMVTVIQDASLRQDLAKRGVEQASAFTWQRTTELTLDAYRRALQLAGRTS